jgi:hypothetical protein
VLLILEVKEIAIEISPVEDLAMVILVFLLLHQQKSK